MLSALLNFYARARAALRRRTPDAPHPPFVPHQWADAADPDEGVL